MWPNPSSEKTAMSEREGFTLLRRITVVRVGSFGLFCVAAGKEVFIPTALIQDPPARPQASEVLNLEVPDWFAAEHGLREKPAS